MIAGVLSACRDPLIDHADSRVCLQTYEFGNYGCVVVQGRVIGTQDQPLPGVAVGPAASADAGQFNGAFVVTDGNGAFQFRLERYSHGPSDSASLWIRATVFPKLPERVATTFDSVLVRVRVAPVGEIPDTGRVVIRLAVP
jgi:hypothetical protein